MKIFKIITSSMHYSLLLLGLRLVIINIQTFHLSFLEPVINPDTWTETPPAIDNALNSNS